MSETLARDLSKVQRAALVCASLGGLVSVIGLFVAPREFFVSYLFAFVFWIGLTLGCFLVTMIHHLTAGRWGEVSRRFLEAGFAPLPAMAVLFVPLLFGTRELYPWARPAEVAADVILQKRGAYASFWGFVIRSVIFLGAWTWMASYLRKWSFEQDRTTDLTPTLKLRRLSAAGVVIYPLTATIAFIDWVMAIEPRWYSTMFPIIICIGQILSAVAFAILAMAWRRNDEPWNSILDKNYLRQFGNLLLAFVLFWTYVSFGQFLIIYSGNLPSEIGWYLHRIAGGWKWILAAIAIFHFFVPFYALLFRRVTRRLPALAAVAALVFLTGILDVYWEIEPTFFSTGIHLDCAAFATFLALGGVWFAIFASSMKRHPVLPRNDPRIHKEVLANAV